MGKLTLKYWQKPAFTVLFSLLAMTNSTLVLAELTVFAAYVREMPPGQTASAAFMQLTNNSSETVILTGGKSEHAAAIEVHQHQHIDGVMHMSRLAELIIKPNETITLEPGGLHLMLMGLEQRLVKGTHFSFELQFVDGQQQTLSLPVISLINP